MNINAILPSTQAQSAYHVDDGIDGVHIFDPATDEVVSSRFWQRELPEGFEERMARGAILLKWRAGAIDSVTALGALMSYGAADPDKIMELFDAYATAIAKVEA